MAITQTVEVPYDSIAFGKSGRSLRPNPSLSDLAKLCLPIFRANHKLCVFKYQTVAKNLQKCTWNRVNLAKITLVRARNTPRLQIELALRLWRQNGRRICSASATARNVTFVFVFNIKLL